MSEVKRTLTEAQQRARRIRSLGLALALTIVGLAGIGIFAATQVGKLEVYVLPDDIMRSAAVTIVEGNGVVWSHSVWGLKNSLKLRVEAKGFVAQEFNVAQSTWSRGMVDVVLREVPTKLRIVTDPEQQNTQWYLNDGLVSQGARLNLEINSGNQSIRAVHPYYYPASREFIAGRGEDIELILSFVPIDGQIEIQSTPNQAQVTMNSKIVGETPLTINVEGGQHELIVAHDGYVSRTDTIVVTNHEAKIKRHYELDRSRVPISFNLSPDGGLLLVNDQAVTSSKHLQLPVNIVHRVRYSKPGFHSKELQFRLESNEFQQIDLYLDHAYGFVEIQSDPDANIEIDGNIVGRTPERLKLQTVPHSIRLMRNKYRTEIRTVLPEVNAMQRIFVTLKSEHHARLEESPLEYTNSVGITLKLFKVSDSFTMGSPRGEIGRRANEFIRKVRLTKPFYVGIHEVTVEQLQEFALSNQSTSAPQLPVAGIDWETAAKFCNWLSAREGYASVYQFVGGQYAGSDSKADGYRMPTEAEWEWLARKAGRQEQAVFTWGDSQTIPPDSGNLADESAKGAVPVYIPGYSDGNSNLSETGSFKANFVGIHDLAGNVSEWTHDGYDSIPPLEDSFETNPMDTSVNGWHTIKGSSWRSGTLSELRASWRDGSNSARDDLGFRIARFLTGDP